MSGVTDSTTVRLSKSAPIEKFLEQFLFKQFEARPRLAHGREVGRDFPSAVATENLGKFAVMGFEDRQRSECGTAKVLEGIVCHDSVSEQYLRLESGLVGFHSRDIDVNGVWQGMGGWHHRPSRLSPSPVGYGCLGEMS